MADDEQCLSPPTKRLPPIRTIQDSSTKDLISAVEYLSRIYNPEINGIHYISRRSCLLTAEGTTSRVENRTSNVSIMQAAEPELDSLRADTFERAHSVRWLTTLVSQTGHLTIENNDWEAVVQKAAHLLAICAGPASAGRRSRTFAFSTGQSREAPKIRVIITDLPLDNRDYSTVGAQTWGGACLLTDMIVRSPQDFGLARSSGDRAHLRILELGSGTGLVGLAVSKLAGVEAIPAEVVLTDFYPSVLVNLRQNIDANTAAASQVSSSNSVTVTCYFLDWSTFPSSHASDKAEPPFNKVFDVIFGADIIYELEHARWIKSCLEILLRKPLSSNRHGTQMSCKQIHYPCFHLVIPLRTTHRAESYTMEEVFPFAPVISGESDAPTTLAIIAKELIVCGDIWSDGRREVEYVYYVISWV